MTIDSVPALPKLKLIRRDANRPASRPTKRRRITSNQPTPSQIPLSDDFTFLKRFKNKLFIVHGPTVLNGYIREQSAITHIPSEIGDLCSLYYIDGEAGIFQIAYKLHRALTKANRRAITMDIVRTLITKYFGIQCDGEMNENIDFWCSELVRLEFLVEIKPKTTGMLKESLISKLYEIAMNKAITFNCLFKPHKSPV